MNHNQLLDEPENTGFIISKIGKIQISSGAKWARFLAILGGAILLFSIFSAATQTSPLLSMLPYASGLIALQIIMFFLAFLPLWFLYQYSTKAVVAVKTENSKLLEEAMRFRKLYYKFFGIYVLILFGILIIAIIAGLSMAQSSLPPF